MPALSYATALLVLASAALHAVWNAMLKRTRDPEDAVTAVLLVSAAASAVTALVLAPSAPPRSSIGWCVVSGLLEAFYFVTLARALSRAPLGPVYTTVRGGSLVVVWPVSVALLGERLSLPVAVGTLLVVLGLVLTGSSETAGARGDDRPLLARLGWAFVCAAFVGAYQLAYKVALVRGGHPASVVAVSLGTASVALTIARGRAHARRAWAATRAEPGKVFAGGVLASAGFTVFLLALRHGGAGKLVTLRNTSILFAQIIAVIGGDRPRRLAVVGALVVTAGAALLALR